MLEACENFIDIDINASDTNEISTDTNNNNLVKQKSRKKSFKFLRKLSLNQAVLVQDDSKDEDVSFDLEMLKQVKKTLHTNDDSDDISICSRKSDQHRMHRNFEYLSSTPKLSSNLSSITNDNSILSFPTLVDSLLEQIYDRLNSTCLDSDVFTEFTISTSRMSDLDSTYTQHASSTQNYTKKMLNAKSKDELKHLANELESQSNKISTKLVKQLKLRDKLVSKQKQNFDLITAVIQAISLKRREDTQMKFSINPPTDELGYQQWLECVRVLCRYPEGIPKCFRKSIWLSCAQQFISDIHLDWKETLRFAFNERTNPDDDQLGLQIVKDLHRTGCTMFNNKDDHALLKRVLLAYARFNKTIGYCQGFNIIAALILEVVERKEDDALMLMIYLIDCIIPSGYFSNSMYTLSIDMSVFRELMRVKLPKLNEKLIKLQQNDNSYEPPLTNVFTMQWFLTLFATCLSKSLVLRLWDSLMIEANLDVLFRVSLVIWERLSEQLMRAESADHFYTLMSELSSQLLHENMFNESEFIKRVYSFEKLDVITLREKYTFNIRPIELGIKSNQIQTLEPVSCFHMKDLSVLPVANVSKQKSNELDVNITELKKQYEKLKQRQQQACIIIQTSNEQQHQQQKHEQIIDNACNHLLMKSIDKNKNTLKIDKRIEFNQRIVAYNPLNKQQPLSSKIIKNGMKLGLYK